MGPLTHVQTLHSVCSASVYLDVWRAEQVEQFPLILLQWFVLKLLCKLVT